MPGLSGQVERPDVVIVGGGIAGLAVAWELSRRGVPFVVLERAARTGGVIFSEDRDGFTIDGGPDALLVQKPDGIRLCEELGLGGRLVPTKLPRLAYIQRGGRLHALPAASVLGIPTRVGPFVRTSLFSWAGKLRMGGELFVPPRLDDADESIGAFMTRRFGREAAAYLAEPLLAGIHAGDVDRLSVKALFPRFVEMERKHGSLLRAFRSTSPGSPAPNPDGAFRSLPGGLSELVRALTNAIGESRIRTGVDVDRIEAAAQPPHRYVVVAGGEAIPARAVIVAVPAHAASGMLRACDAALADLCGGIEYASIATVALAFARGDVEHPLNGSGYVVPRVEDRNVIAVSWLSSKWPHRAPEGAVLLRTFIGGARDPGALDLSDGDLVARSLTALRPIVGVTGEPRLARVYRWPRASAQHHVGHLDRVAAIDRALARRPGLFVTGSGFRGVGIPDCVADGRATARQVSEWLALNAES